MDGWVGGWMGNGWMGDCLNSWLDEWMVECMGGRHPAFKKLTVVMEQGLANPYPEAKSASHPSFFCK